MIADGILIVIIATFVVWVLSSISELKRQHQLSYECVKKIVDRLQKLERDKK